MGTLRAGPCRYEENESMWSKIKAEILGESDSDDEEGDDEDGDDDDDDSDADADGQSQAQMTQQVQVYMDACGRSSRE